MSLGFKVVPLESAIKPHHLLYLFFGSPKCAEAGRLLGSLIAQHPPESNRYLTEAVMTWARHAEGTSPKLAELQAAPLRAPTLVKYHLSLEMRSAWPRKEVLGSKIGHSRQLVRILHAVSKQTTFTRSGDRMVHSTLYSDMDGKKICRLSLHELPYQMTKEHYGPQANRRVRPLFENDPEIRFSQTDWKLCEGNAEMALMGCLLAETPGVSFQVPVLVKHQITFARDPLVPALFIDDWGYGILWNKTFLTVNPTTQYPLAAMLIRYLELQALLGSGPGLAAQAVLRAIKEPERVRALPPVLLLPRRVLSCGRPQVGVREPLYPLVNAF